MAPKGSKQRETLPETYWDTVLVEVCRRSPGCWSETSLRWQTVIIENQDWRIPNENGNEWCPEDRKYFRLTNNEGVSMTANGISCTSSTWWQRFEKQRKKKKKENTRHAHTSMLLGHRKPILVSAVLFSQNSYFQGFFSSQQVSIKVKTVTMLKKQKYHILNSRATQRTTKRKKAEHWFMNGHRFLA